MLLRFLDKDSIGQIIQTSIPEDINEEEAKFRVMLLRFLDKDSIGQIIQTPIPEDINEEEAKFRARERYRWSWLVALFSSWRVMSWLNPGIGITVAAIAIPIGTILSASFVDLEATRMLSDMASVSIVGGGLLFAAVTIVPFTMWEAIKHYQEWRRVHAEEYSNRRPHYGDYLLAIPNQISEWASKHPGQVFVMVLGIIVTSLMMGFGIGFFTGDEFSAELLSPIIYKIPAMLYWGLHGLGQLPGLSFLEPSDLFAGSGFGNGWVVFQVMTIIVFVAVPLVMANMFRQAIQTGYEARQAGGKLVGGEGEGYNPLEFEKDADRQAYIELVNDFEELFSSTVTHARPDVVSSNTKTNFLSSIDYGSALL